MPFLRVTCIYSRCLCQIREKSVRSAPMGRVRGGPENTDITISEADGNTGFRLRSGKISSPSGSLLSPTGELKLALLNFIHGNYSSSVSSNNEYRANILIIAVFILTLFGKIWHYH